MSSSNTTAQFNTDFANLQNDIGVDSNENLTGGGYMGATTQQSADNTTYFEDTLPEFNKLIQQNPMEALMYMFYSLFENMYPISPDDSVGDNGTVSGLMNDQMGIYGYQMAANSDLTACLTDIQNVTTGATPVNGPQGLIVVANETDMLLDLFPGGGTGVNGKSSAAEQCFGTSTSTQIYNNLLQVRQTIFWGDDPEGATYNPNKNVPINPGNNTANRSYYFSHDANYDGSNYDGNYMSGFTDTQGDYYYDTAMSTLMGVQGDPYQANEASKALTDDFNILTTTTQGVNAAVNQEVSQETSTLQNVQSFIAACMKSTIDLISTATQNQISR